MPAIDRSYDFNASIATEAAVVAADAALTRTVHAARLSLSAGGPGVVVLRDGVGGTVVASLYLTAAPTASVVAGAEVWGTVGKRLTKGNALTATLAGATLQCQVSVTEEG